MVYIKSISHARFSSSNPHLNLAVFQGVPIRIEIGPRDVSNRSLVISRRDIPGKQGKVFGVSMEPAILVPYVKDKLDEIQAALLSMATSFRDRYIVGIMQNLKLNYRWTNWKYQFLMLILCMPCTLSIHALEHQI